MKLIVGGARGTSPACYPDFVKYGGDTTSFLIEGAGGERILVDAGTGVRALGNRLEADAKASSVLLLMTHYHLDHLMGLPSLPLLYSDRWSIEMAAPEREDYTVEDIMHRILAKPFWPLQMGQMSSDVDFTTLPGESSASPLRLDGLEIRWCPVHHPDGCTAYRIDEPSTGASCVIATDIEWQESTHDEMAALGKMCSEPGPANVLIFDGQYTPEEYGKVRGWGHSTWNDAVNVAREARAGRLLVTHHAPSNDDTRLAVIEKDVSRSLPVASLARAGMEITLGKMRIAT